MRGMRRGGWMLIAFLVGVLLAAMVGTPWGRQILGALFLAAGGVLGVNVARREVRASRGRGRAEEARRTVEIRTMDRSEQAREFAREQDEARERMGSQERPQEPEGLTEDEKRRLDALKGRIR